VSPLRVDTQGAPFDDPRDRETVWPLALAGAALGLANGSGGYTFSYVPALMRFEMHGNVVAANQFLWMGSLITHRLDDPFGSDGVEGRNGIGDRTHVMEQIIGMPIANAAPNRIIGFGLGTCDTPVIPAAPNSMLAVLYARMSTTPRWELLVARGNGSTAALIAVLAGVPPPTFLNTFHIRLVYSPKSFVAAFVSGIEGARIVDADRMPRVDGQGQIFAPQIFISSGDTNAGDVNHATFVNPTDRIMGK
jgi:hypothetical protein